jgi:hypothetical protein
LTEAARNGHHEAAFFLVAHNFKPQELQPAATGMPGPVEIDPVYPINARSHEAVGDYLVGQNDEANALVNYRSAAKSYEAAVANYQQSFASFTQALADAKAGRKSRIFSMIALDAIGTGLAAATGVGFVVVPKRNFNKHIDDYTEELDRNRAELATLTREQSDLSAKLLKLEKADNTAAEIPTATPQPVPVSTSPKASTP